MPEDARVAILREGLIRVGCRIVSEGERMPRELGLPSVPRPEMLCFATSADWYRALREHASVAGVIVRPDVVDDDDPRWLVAVHEDPRAAFYGLHAWLATATDFYAVAATTPPRVSVDADVDERAVLEDGTQVGARTRIAAGAVLVGGTRIGEDCYIGSNAIIGGDGFQVFRDEQGRQWPCPHVGDVVIGDRVVVKGGTCVDRALWGSTTIERDVQIDHLVSIAHNVSIGAGTVIAAGCAIGGSTTIGTSCWLGLNAAVRDGLTIGDRAFIGMGTVVTEDVPAEGRRLPVGSLTAAERRALRSLLADRSGARPLPPPDTVAP